MYAITDLLNLLQIIQRHNYLNKYNLFTTYTI